MPFFRTKTLTAILGVAVASVAPGAVQAQSPTARQFQVPDGCTAFLTVQSRSCLVAHHWRCDADPAGSHWRVTLDQDGAFYLNYTDDEFRWLRSFDLRDGSRDILIEPEDDPASMSELLETGRDTMVFSVREESSVGTFQRDYTGYDSLTGQYFTIDGHELEMTEFAYQWETGGGPRSTEGNQFISREWGLFFGGLETVTLPAGDSIEGNYSPVEFAEPGEDGFLALQPQYDCGDIMSALPAPPIWRVGQ